MPQLSLHGVVKTYGQTRALDGAGLDLRGGEIHALMGENGAGKSTLIRILAGLEAPDAGQIILDGAAVSLTSPAAAEGLGLRFLHQELQIVPALSVAENMHLAHPYPSFGFGLVNWRALRAAAQVALDRLGVSHIDPEVTMADLGPGDQMLTRIAATLIDTQGPRPWAYVLDEPTAALTGAEAERLFAALHTLRAAGHAILYVSHRMDEVLALSDRVTVLRDGRHVSTLPRDQVSRDQIIQDMTGRDFATLYPPAEAPAGGAPLLEVRSLQAGLLRDMNFTLHAGEVLGLAGLSGSGRNHLLRALMGAVPRRGQVLVKGQGTGQTPAAAWAAGLAYVPRERRAEGLMLHQPLADTVALPHIPALSTVGFVRRSWITRLVARLAQAVRLKAQSQAQVAAELSGGNQQKVLFARALAGPPVVLLLDEPTRGVDVGAKFDIYATIRGLTAQGVGVVMVSSDLPELIGLSDRIGILQGGRLTQIIPAAGLTEGALLALCYEKEVA
jgi:ABC-type sugar transport system ATPase subunit